MQTRSTIAALIAITIAGSGTASLHGQSTGPNVKGLTPAGCTKAINSWRAAEVAGPLSAYTKANSAAAAAVATMSDSAIAATTKERASALASYQAASAIATPTAIRAASACAARFNVAKVSSALLSDLIPLYTIAKDTSSTRRATERLLIATDLPPVGRATVMVMAMNQEIAKVPSLFGIIEGAEKQIARLDEFAASVKLREVDSVRLNAHSTMLGRYEYLDVADGLRHHALAVIDLARKLEKPATMITGYHSLARSYADMLQPDSALMILDRGSREIGPSADSSYAFTDFRDRYALIGQPAASISGKWWINSDRKPEDFVMGNGKVTLVEFTAHWCGPCKNSYPGITSLVEGFKGKDFQGVMVTQLYGYLGDKPKLTPDEEVAADRIYFGTEHNVPFPVAISPQSGPAAVDLKTGKVVVPARPKADLDYRVGGIPQLVIIDKKGIIRQIVTGWDQGNTARFSKYINVLLNEKVM